MIRKQIVSSCMVLVTILTFCQLCYAALGGNSDTIVSDRKSLQAVRHATTSNKGYTVEEVVSDATTVREYVSSSGIVFGIAWNGYVHPDLTQLLGSYWNEYSAAQQKIARKFGRKHQQLATDNIVIEKWGHMRNLKGRAYVPGLVPAGVSIDEIK
ncbi:MAG: DUF2844 domain-containing protein [Desulfuromonadales bacterium]|nr:DUF2844 domain-containing protein [Desulfuromonadales bacterium]